MLTNKQPCLFIQEAAALPTAWPTTTRRAILGSIAATAVLAATVTMPSSAVAFSNRSIWDAAFRRHTAAMAEDAAYNAVFSPLYEQCKKAEQSIPHITFRPDPYTGMSQAVSTADLSFVKRARRLVDDVATGKCRLDALPDLQAHYSLCREVAAAADDRDIKIAAVRARFGIDEAEAKWEALGEAAYDAEWAIMDMPAPDLAALRWKLEKLLHVDSDEGSVASWSAKAIEVTMADVRRLLTGEA